MKVWGCQRAQGFQLDEKVLELSRGTNGTRRALHDTNSALCWRRRKLWVCAMFTATAEVATSSSLPTVWISLYYAAFYVVMTGLFALCIYVLMQTIDPYTPDYQDQLKSPGEHQEGISNAFGEAYRRADPSPHTQGRAPTAS